MEFPNELAEFVFYRTYSRWREDLGRRETRDESIQRLMGFFRRKCGSMLSEEEYALIEQYEREMKVQASRRAAWSAGPAAEKENVCIYNCSYRSIDDLSAFDEILYILMCGAGAGFSVEERFVSKLPIVKPFKPRHIERLVVEDCREGWAAAVRFAFERWWDGEDVIIDYSQIRPYGARLVTMGGRSSGPEPLRRLMEFARDKIVSRQGTRLSSLDCHDIMCMIGDVVVVGGVRRSSLISLSDLRDTSMRHAKTGEFYRRYPYRSMSNNSAVYEERPPREEFFKEWNALRDSGTGERGIFNRMAARTMAPMRRNSLLIEGVNPCGEINLRSKEFCNLCTIVARPEDTVESLVAKARVAALVDTVQSLFTDFRYLSADWKQNCEEERLLGVSITGQMDCPLFLKDPHERERMLNAMQTEVIRANHEYAERFGINQSAATTCIKPEGTNSLVVGSGSGVHARPAPYYVRRVRISSSDPLFQLARDSGVPHFPEVGQRSDNARTWVLEFPVKSPDGAITAEDLTAHDQLEYWLSVKRNFTEHNPSCTIYVRDHEWESVGEWVYQNFEYVGGLSFLPLNNHVYELAPIEKITAEQYEERKKLFPHIDYMRLSQYEQEDQTIGAKEFACTSGACELV